MSKGVVVYYYLIPVDILVLYGNIYISFCVTQVALQHWQGVKEIDHKIYCKIFSLILDEHL